MFGVLSLGGLNIQGKFVFLFNYSTICTSVIINIKLPDWYDTLFHTVSKTRNS